jgi:hypothetical protein
MVIDQTASVINYNHEYAQHRFVSVIDVILGVSIIHNPPYTAEIDVKSTYTAEIDEQSIISAEIDERSIITAEIS